MTEYSGAFKRYIRLTLFFLAILVLGYGFTPYQSIFLGLLLGTIGGLYNLISMYRKIDRLGQAIVEGQRAKTLGSLTRMLTAGLAVLIALRYPEMFHLVSVVVGLMSVYAIIFIDSLLQHYVFKKKRGEN
jgi:ATP synthase protein I